MREISQSQKSRYLAWWREQLEFLPQLMIGSFEMNIHHLRHLHHLLHRKGVNSLQMNRMEVRTKVLGKILAGNRKLRVDQPALELRDIHLNLAYLADQSAPLDQALLDNQVDQVYLEVQLDPPAQ